MALNVTDDGYDGLSHGSYDFLSATKDMAGWQGVVCPFSQYNSHDTMMEG